MIAGKRSILILECTLERKGATIDVENLKYKKCIIFFDNIISLLIHP